ncbi:MAG: rhomboid family intramembrane serine protease [Verrucomicrobia bacterium]|nr:rhomboid family intramembrane serine protease [Verrucomicrobiota bacterium]
MATPWQRWFALVSPGVRGLLALLTGAYLAAAVGRVTHTFELSAWLALSSPEFWGGRVWQVVTYALLPATIMDFLFNGLMIVWLGGWVERVWSRGELWLYCGICAVGAGLAKVLLTPASPDVMVGTTGVVMGLLAAVARLFGHERTMLMGAWETSVRTATLAIAAASLLLMAPMAGLLNAAVMLSGGLTGWVYLSLRWKAIHAQRSRAVTSQRIGRLEL